MNFQVTIRLLQRVAFFLFVIGPLVSITLWQFSLLAAQIFTLIRFLTEERQRQLLRGLALPGAAIFLFILWGVIASEIVSPGSGIESLYKTHWMFLVIPVIWSVLADSSLRLFRLPLQALSILVISLVLIMGISYLFGHNLLDSGNESFILGGRASGMSGLPITFALCLLVYGILFLMSALDHRREFPNRILLWGGAIAAVVGIVMSGSRMPIAVAIMIPIAIAIVYRASIPKRTRLLLIGIPILALASALTFNLNFFYRSTEHVIRDISSDYTGGRNFIWGTTGKIIADHPWLGGGENGFASEYLARIPAYVTKEQQYTHPHNDLLNETVKHGIPGGVLFCLIWLVVLMRGYQNVRKGQQLDHPLKVIQLGSLIALFGLLLCSLTDIPFGMIKVRGLLLVLWGVVLFPVSEWSDVTARESKE